MRGLMEPDNYRSPLSSRYASEAMRRNFESAQSRFTSAQAQVNALNPQLVLERGYSIAETTNGALVRDADTLAAGDELRLTFARGRVAAEVKRKL